VDDDLDGMTREELIREARRQFLDEQLPDAPRSEAPYQP
jgi:hypothetical protein